MGGGEAMKGSVPDRQDVLRRLGELAFGSANDCVRLALEDGVRVEGLDLSQLAEVRRSEKGVIEIKLIDRLKALEQLAALAVDRQDAEKLLAALRGE